MSSDGIASAQESIVDLVNDLKAENADLRRSLIAATAFRSSNFSADLVVPTTTDQDGDRSNGIRIQDSVSTCRACLFLESQADRLMGEIESLRSSHADALMLYETKARQLMEALSRENQRRTRMESIIQRQQVHLRELTEKLRQITVGDEAEYESSYRDLDIPTSDAGRRRQPPVWEFDMDDLNRQLDELNENVHRVEEFSNRLTSSTRVAFSQHLPGERSSVTDEAHSPTRSIGRSVLTKLMSGT